MSDRVPPQDLNAEKCTLGCMVLSNSAVDDVRDIVKSSDFYADVNAIIFKAILSLRDSGVEVDPATLADQLRSVGKYDDVGGFDYIQAIMDAVPFTTHAKYYAKIVLRMSRRRKAIDIGQSMVDAAWNMTRDIDDVSELAAKAASDLSEKVVIGSKVTPMVDIVAALIQDFEKGVKPSVSVLIPAVDEITRGIVPGEMIVVGGRPSHGKSAFALQSLDMAVANGLPSLMISEEMSAMSLGVRMMQRMTTLPDDTWLNETSRLRFDAREHMQGHAPLLVAEKCGTVAAVERVIESAVRTHKIKVLAIDYAQLIEGVGGNDQEQISYVSNRIKAITTKYDLITIMLAQMNRAIENREGYVPQLADLRGSGSLEQDADVVLFTIWPWQFDKSYRDPLEYRIHQCKNRNRGIPVSCLPMRINPARQRFDAVEKQEEGYQWQ